jgi:TATA-binding protein-associated factor
VEQEIGTESSGKGATHIFQALQYLRRLCNHPLLVTNDKYPNYAKVQNFLQKTNTSLHDIGNAPKLLALKKAVEKKKEGDRSDLNTYSYINIGNY